MDKRHFFTILFTLLFAGEGLLYAQIAPTTDSLKAVLEHARGEQRAEVLLQLSGEMRRSNIDSAIVYARRALELSQQIENEYLEAASHRNLGWFFSISGRYPEALEHLLEAKTMFEQLGDLQKEAITLKNLGALYKNQNNNKQALEYYFSALSLSEQLNNREDLPQILLNIGIINERLNQPEESIEFYKRALKVSEEIDDPNDIAISAVSLGELHADLRKNEEALEAMKKALEASEKLPGVHAKATILMAMSSVYNNQQSYEQALDANEKALELARDMSDKMLESLALKNMATVYSKQGDYAEANRYLLQSLPLVNETGIQQHLIETQNRIARNFYEMDELQKTIDHATEALEISQETKAFDLSLDALELLTKTHQKLGDYQLAFTAQQTLNAVKDSIFNREQSRQIAEMQTRYETEQKEQEIALLQQEKEKAELIRNAFIAGLVLIFIIGFLIYNRQRLKIKKNQTELENNRLMEEQLKQDLEFKNKQLTTHTLNLVQKNELMKELKEEIEDIKKSPGQGFNKKLNSLEHLVDYSFNLDKDWEEFKLYFEEIHTGFFEGIKRQYPDLTPNELRLSALIKLNLTTKEIATIMGITPDSVKTARYRLRKKLGMETEENLTEFMMEVEKEQVG